MMNGLRTQYFQGFYACRSRTQDRDTFAPVRPEPSDRLSVRVSCLGRRAAPSRPVELERWRCYLIHVPSRNGKTSLLRPKLFPRCQLTIFISTVIHVLFRLFMTDRSASTRSLVDVRRYTYRRRCIKRHSNWH